MDGHAKGRKKIAKETAGKEKDAWNSGDSERAIKATTEERRRILYLFYYFRWIIK